MNDISSSKYQAFYKLQASIETLYQTFAIYPLSEKIEGCEHCVTDKDHKHLHARPLKELDNQDLSKYAFKAMTTWGDEKDFKHFLSRLFELHKGLTNIEILFSKLSLAHWRTWPQIEQNAIEAYFGSLWQFIIISGEPAPWYTDCDEYLCAIAQAKDNLLPFLDAWQNNQEILAMENLAAFIKMNIERLTQNGILDNAFWEEQTAQMMQVIGWLLHILNLEPLKRVCYLFSEDSFREEYMEAIDQLEELQNVAS